MSRGKREQPRTAPRRRMGNTDRLGYILVFILALGLAGGFVLAVLSIKYQYTGALACWTVVFTPIGTALSVVLSRIVEKNRAENTSAEGEGVKYAAAAAAGFQEDTGGDDYGNSPPI